MVLDVRDVYRCWEISANFVFVQQIMLIHDTAIMVLSLNKPITKWSLSQDKSRSEHAK